MDVIKERALLEIRERAQLLVSYSLLPADRRVDLDSEAAADQAGHLSVDEGEQRRRQPRARLEAVPHPPETPEDLRTASQHRVVEKRRSVARLLAAELGVDVVVIR